MQINVFKSKIVFAIAVFFYFALSLFIRMHQDNLGNLEYLGNFIQIQKCHNINCYVPGNSQEFNSVVMIFRQEPKCI